MNYVIKEYPVEKNKSGLELQDKLITLYLDPSYSKECGVKDLPLNVDSKTFISTLKKAAKYNRELYDECYDLLN